MKERRNKPRVMVNSEAEILGGDQKIRCRILDIAGQGVGLLCKQTGTVGTVFDLRLFLPDGIGWVQTHARLVRCESTTGGFVWGMAFVNLDQMSALRINGYIRDQITVKTVRPTKPGTTPTNPAPVKPASTYPGAGMAKTMREVLKSALADVSPAPSKKR